MYSKFFKRLIDIVLSGLGIIFLSPVFLILAIAIKLDSKGPVFYRQTRVTRYGKEFRIFKFRTMVQNADKIGALVTVEKDPRITKVGKIIFNYQFFNRHTSICSTNSRNDTIRTKLIASILHFDICSRVLCSLTNLHFFVFFCMIDINHCFLNLLL